MTSINGPVALDDLLAHRRWVRALARRLASDENAADDLEQETWVAALRNPPRHGGALRGWLATVLRNVARTSARRRDCRARHEMSAWTATASSFPDDVVAEAELQALLVHAVLDLAEPCRSTVLLRYFHGLEPRDIAVRLDVPVATVKTRLKRAIRRLREEMQSDLGDDRDAWCLLVLGRRAREIATRAVPVTTSGAASVGGVLLMKKVVVAAIALLLLVGGAVWTASEVRESRARDASASADAMSSASTAARAERARTRAQAPDTATPPPAGPAPTIDLAHVDRDLDLHGVVVRKDGTPIADAAIQAVRYPWRRADTLHEHGAAEPIAGATAASSSDGTFAVRLPRGTLVALRVSHPGLAPVELLDLQAGERVRVVLGPGVGLVVTARDPSGALLPGRRLRLDGALDEGAPTVERSGETGSDGTWTCRDLPAGCRVIVASESFGGDADPQLLMLPDAGEGRADLVIEPGRTVRGRVTDADTGAAIEGARVGAGRRGLGGVKSAADGTFLLGGFPVRRAFELGVAADGYSSRAARVPPADFPAEVVLDFALRRGYELRGRLVRTGGAPVAAACVSAVGQRHDGATLQASIGYARTGADGAFAIGDLDRELVHVVTFVADGAGRVQRAVARPRTGEYEVDLGDVVLPAPRCVEGRVLDVDGSPVGRREIKISGPKPPEDADFAFTYGNTEYRMTDDLGRFRFPDLAPGLYTLATGVANEPDLTQDVVVPQDQDVAGVVLRRVKTRAVAVHVVDESGRPVPGALVNVVSPAGFGGSSLTGADGIARLETSESALEVSILWLVEALADRYVLPEAPVELAAGTAAEVTIALRPASTVRGVVLGPDGKPLCGVWVRGVVDGRRVAGDRSAADGSFRLVVPRQATLDVVVDGTASVELREVDLRVEGRADGVAAGASGVVVRCASVETGRTVSFRVTTPGGDPLEGAQITLWAILGEAATVVTTDAKGLATGKDLTSRTYHVVVAPSGELLGPRAISVIPAGQEVALAMRATTPISGTVVLPDGRPVPRAQVSVDADDDAPRAVTTDDHGRFTVLVPRGSPEAFVVEASGSDALGPYSGSSRGVRGGERDVRLVVGR